MSQGSGRLEERNQFSLLVQVTCLRASANTLATNEHSRHSASTCQRLQVFLDCITITCSREEEERGREEEREGRRERGREGESALPLSLHYFAIPYTQHMGKG